MTSGDAPQRSLGWDIEDLGQEREQELHDDRIGRLYLGLEGDDESRRRAVSRIEWMLTTCLPGNVLDVGCSEGILSILAARRGHQAEGWDINPTSIQSAREFAAEMLGDADPSPTFVVRDIFRVPELAPHYDNVVLGEVIEHVFEPEAMIRRSVLALREHGRLIITTPWGHFPAPDHHQTFTLTNFLSKIPEVVEWERVDVIDGYIRFAGTRALTPGASGTSALRKRNAEKFPPARLLEISERAAIESQRFLRTTLATRYSMWQTAKDVADKHHATAQRATAQVGQLQTEVDRLSTEALAATSDATLIRDEASRLAEEVARLAESAVASARAEEQLKVLEHEVAALRAQLEEARDAVRVAETRLDHALVLSTRRGRRAYQRALEPDRDDPMRRQLGRAGQLLRRAAASHPSLRRRLLRHLPDPWILKLDRVTRTPPPAGSRPPPNPLPRGGTARPPGRAFAGATALRTDGADVLSRLEGLDGPDLHLVCGAYPDGSGQYGGEFLRARVEGYRARGVRTLVISVHQRHAGVELVPREEAGLLQVPPDQLGRLLAILDRNRSVPTAVHAPTPEVGRFFLRRARQSPTAFFMHGAEARDYRRLHFNYTTEEMELRRERLDRANAERADFLREASADQDARLVFVSDYLRKVAEVDFDLDLAHAHVIHNVIDGEFFTYRERAAEERQRLLLVRNFQQYNYGNDIALRALEIALKEPDFEAVTVTIRGFGEYFQPLTESLQSLSNVDVIEGYVDSCELRRLHDEHGVFLVPTRHDTQGVSMGEAMASGLVCVTNRVAAIPEFASAKEAVLVEGESPGAYAAALVGLLRDPDGFVQRSRSAAARVREQCGIAATVERELELFGFKAER